ncbi:hypothetical protein P4661_25630 [Priestia megaterium]|uniref:malate dehydrogenase n=1 Tax=Priestia megaterium TaxID=1404 RepID=UPI002E1C3C33|nr:hypothetical protein [Priestia megaterium]
MSKVSIIGGAGTLGATVGFLLSTSKKVEEVCLIDRNEKLLQNHLMDMQNALPSMKIYGGSWENLAGSDVVVITAGVSNRNDVASRNEFLQGNIEIFKLIGKQLIKYAPHALIVTASNPVDILNFYLYKHFQFKREQLIGYTLNDSLRFEWALKKVLSLHKKDTLQSPVLGEHGSSQVPIYSRVVLNNQPLILSAKEKEKVQQEIQSWFSKFNGLQINRTTGWTSGVGLTTLIDKLISSESNEIIGSAVVEGEYGLRELSIGVPLSVNNKGIQKVHEWTLELGEQEALLRSAQTIQQLLKEVDMVSIK